MVVENSIDRLLRFGVESDFFKFCHHSAAGMAMDYLQYIHIDNSRPSLYNEYVPTTSSAAHQDLTDRGEMKPATLDVAF